MQAWRMEEDQLYREVEDSTSSGKDVLTMFSLT